VIYNFGWDVKKARGNLKKHEIAFPLATTVFRDPLAITIFDEEHSDDEDRWVTLGQAENGQILVVVHTAEETGETETSIRIISSRRADHGEVRDYEQTPR
jgi:uncharacterized DUF497 family protein